MRTALVGRPMVGFDAPALVGPVPAIGRIVEVVETRGKHLEVVWDDGIVLDTPVRGRTEWHVYRRGDPWRKSGDRLRASIQTDDFVAVCFDASHVETYREPDPRRHPGRGRLGPDLARTDSAVGEAIELLLAYPAPETRLREVLVDQRVMRGIGNVYRCEVLWAAELSPWTHVGDLAHHDVVLIVNLATRVVRSNVGRDRRSTTTHTSGGLAVYGRVGQGCIRCKETIEARPLGHRGQMLYWCPGCQTRLDRRLPAEIRQIDPHPAAAKFLHDLRHSVGEPAHRAHDA